MNNCFCRTSTSKLSFYAVLESNVAIKIVGIAAYISGTTAKPKNRNR